MKKIDFLATDGIALNGFLYQAKVYRSRSLPHSETRSSPQKISSGR